MTKHSMTTQDLWDWMCELRNVETPCKRCGGAGVSTYASSSTWGGGAGGMTPTSGVCDRCWGTGDEIRKGASYRLIQHWKNAYEREQKRKTCNMNIDNIEQYLVDKHKKTVLARMSGPVSLFAVDNETIAVAALQLKYKSNNEIDLAKEIADEMDRTEMRFITIYEINTEKNVLRYGIIK